jgi:hypothetical protein
MGIALIQTAPVAEALADDIDPPELVLLDPEEPAPPLSADQREPARAWSPEGPLDPPVWAPVIEGTPDEVMAKLADGAPQLMENGAIYEINGAHHLAAVYTQPVNFLDGDGGWKPISTDLIPDGTGGLRNEANAFTTSFPGQLSAPIRSRSS